MTSLVASPAPLLQERASKRIVIKIFTLANNATQFWLDLNWAMDIKMPALAALSALEGLVFLLFGVENHRGDKLFLISLFVKQLIVRVIFFVFLHRLRELVIIVLIFVQSFFEILIRLSYI